MMMDPIGRLSNPPLRRLVHDLRCAGPGRSKPCAAHDLGLGWKAELSAASEAGRDTAQAMSQENVEVVCDQFAATNERDFPRAMSHYAEDVELVVDPEAFLDAGTFKGRHAVGQWFGNWFATFEPGYHFQVEEARDLGDVVLLVASHHGRGRNSGVEVHGRTGYVYTLRGGKVVRVELYPSRAKALDAAGLRH
jgi:ketosteroid isomerase-like protein